MVMEPLPPSRSLQLSRYSFVRVRTGLLVAVGSFSHYNNTSRVAGSRWKNSIMADEQDPDVGVEEEDDEEEEITDLSNR